MTIDRTRRISLDLLVADLDAPDAVVALVGAHAVAPARALCGMPRPAPGDDEVDILAGVTLSFNLLDMRPLWRGRSPDVASIDGFIRGYVLFASLFPGAVDSQYVAEEFFTLPGSAILERAFPLARLRWHDIEVLVDGLWGGRTGRPVSPAIRWLSCRPSLPHCAPRYSDHDPGGCSVADDSDTLHLREDVGLQAMDPGAVFGLDEILRLDCHSRLLWLGDTEMAFDVDGPDPEAVVPLTIDRGVFTVVVPESLPGLVALDFVETLRLDPRTALCAVCRRPILLSPQQAARQRKGEPVYHPDCHDEHRLRYVREFQRQRRASRPATDAAAEHAM